MIQFVELTRIPVTLLFSLDWTLIHWFRWIWHRKISDWTYFHLRFLVCLCSISLTVKWISHRTNFRNITNSLSRTGHNGLYTSAMSSVYWANKRFSSSSFNRSHLMNIHLVNVVFSYKKKSNHQLIRDVRNVSLFISYFGFITYKYIYKFRSGTFKHIWIKT